MRRVATFPSVSIFLQTISTNLFFHTFCGSFTSHRRIVCALVRAEVGKRTGISSFYVAFVIAPLASNASELIASYSYALKKTPASISISLQALQGAACMNNTFCLSIFMALIYFQVFAFKLSEVHQLLMQSINMALG